MPATYRPYGFCDDAPYNSRMSIFMKYMKNGDCACDEDDIKETITTAVESSLSGVNDEFARLHNHIDCAKCCIINHTANKSDVTAAAEGIKAHIDGKFDEIDFPANFSNLNEQMALLLAHQ
ncbi:MAG: hypothetical protein J6Y37_09900 [Paludibacteraceae bacterium]|nr:hypothetical protein [Paludibacteraceae bacterium]